MTIYVLLGDTPRSDLDNVECAYLDKEEAQYNLKCMIEEFGEYTNYHIEELKVKE